MPGIGILINPGTSPEFRISFSSMRSDERLKKLFDEKSLEKATYVTYLGGFLKDISNSFMSKSTGFISHFKLTVLGST